MSQGMASPARSISSDDEEILRALADPVEFQLRYFRDRMMIGRKFVDNADWQKRETRRLGVAIRKRDENGAASPAMICSAWPREFGKTTIRQIVTLWAILCGYRRYALIFRANQSIASGEMGDYMRIFQQPSHLLMTDFGLTTWAQEVRRTPALSWCGQKLHLRNIYGQLCTIEALGAGSPARGQIDNGLRPDLILLDDVETTEGTWSKAMRESLARWLSHDIEALGSGAVIAFWQTVISPNSLMSKCLTSADWQGRRFPAIDDEGNSTWPARYSTQYLSELREKKPPSAWLADYQNLPQANDVTLFPTDSWRLYETEGIDPPKRDRLARVSIGVDLAFSAEKSSDYTAISAWGEDGQGNKHHLMTVRGRWTTPEEVIRRIRSVNDIVRADIIAIEDVSSSKHFIQFARREMGYIVKGISPEGLDKTARARSVSHFWELGAVWCRKADTLIVGEMYSFRPDVKDQTDDVVDAAVYALMSMKRSRIEVSRV